MKNYLYVVWTILILAAASIQVQAAGQWKDTLVVARDGTGDYRTLTEAMEGIRAFMDYKVTVLIKNGVYKEKVIVPSWLQNVDFVGESAEGTVITYDDHANINKTMLRNLVRPWRSIQRATAWCLSIVAF